MISRPLTGTALNVVAGKLVAVPIDPAPADPTVGTLVPGAPIEYVIAEGAISGTIQAPATYRFTFFDGAWPVHSFTASVPDSSGAAIAIEEIIRNSSVPIDALPLVVREGEPISKLVAGDGEADQFLGRDAEGGLEWRDFDGTHTHPTADVTGLDATLASKSEVGHGHPISDVIGLQGALDGKAEDGDVLTVQGNLHTHEDNPAPHSGHLKRSPTSAADNEVQAYLAGYPIIRLRRHAASVDTDHVWEYRSADGSTVLMAINAKGNIGIGGAPDSTALEYGLFLVGRDLEMTTGNRIRERGYGAAISFSPNAGSGVQVQAPFQVGTSNALPSGQLEVVTGAATRISEYIRLAAAQTANAVEIRSSDGATLYYGISSTGIILHSGIQSLGGNTRGANAVDLQTFRNNAAYVASGVYAAIGGGSSNTASGNWATIPGGEANVASATPSFAWGRAANCAHPYSAVFGDYTVSRWQGALTFGFGRSVTSAGEAGRHLVPGLCRTTDATATALASLTIIGKQTVFLNGWITARRSTGSSDIACFEVKALITRDVTGNVSLITSTVTPYSNVPGYSVAITSDTPTNTLRVMVTGAAGHDIMWNLSAIVTDCVW